MRERLDRPHLSSTFEAIDRLVEPGLAYERFAELYAAGVQIVGTQDRWSVLRATGLWLLDIGDTASVRLARELGSRGCDLFEPYPDLSLKLGPTTNFLHDAICDGSATLLTTLLEFGADPRTRLPNCSPTLNGFDVLEAYYERWDDEGERRAILEGWRTRKLVEEMLTPATANGVRP